MQTAEPAFRVFVVDDEASARLTAVAALDTTEFAVREFSTAQEMLDALDDFTSETPDLILLDIEMPGSNGRGLSHAAGQRSRCRAGDVRLVPQRHRDTAGRL
jgi:CheY-like chemotaxis protein